MDTGRLAPFDPRPYEPRWHLHRSEEKFVGWIEDKLGGVRTETPTIGDVVVYRFGRCYSHGGLLINSKEIVHAYFVSGMTMTSALNDPVLEYVGVNGTNFPRPKLFFDVWGGAA